MSEEIITTPLDHHFALLMRRLHGAPDAELEHVARTVSAWRGAGHTCVPLGELGGEGLAEKLQASPVVGEPGEFKPLILDAAGRVYLQRYWAYEADLAAAIRARLVDAECDSALLVAGLKRLFPKAKKGDGQRAAAEMAVQKRFAVITGGPGTGKTYTAARVLALLAEQFSAHGKNPRLALAAPTGKAAARLQESIARALAQMPETEPLRRTPPGEASTLHRLLGTLPDSPQFRHTRGNPLAVDVVLVDEASMVDLALMAKLFAAVPPSARVILLGDKDQLASVEAGNVLGDICGSGNPLQTATIAPHIAELKTVHRFGESSGIQALSERVNAGDADGALALLHEGKYADLRRTPTPAARTLGTALKPHVLEGCREFLEQTDPAAALARVNAFRILCATRRGPFGVENLNALATHILADAGLIAPDAAHYHGRPVLIGTNDYQLRLFNGDVGLIFRDPESGNELRAFFIDATGALRRVLPARLPTHETSYAMTIHKSQGSEFDRVLLVLPDRDTPVATRELLYTGLTRARSSIDIWADDPLIIAALARRTQRTSGLRDALWRA
ncbi:MAG: exodeoxyribonuclease V subunit alpha [Chthoniobacteraceae bacterium]